MNVARIIATAGLVIASLGAATAANAQNYGVDPQHQNDRHDQRYQNVRRDHRNGDNRDDQRGRYGRRDDRRDNGNRDGWRNARGHNRCHIEWRHHHQIRVCR